MAIMNKANAFYDGTNAIRNKKKMPFMMGTLNHHKGHSYFQPI